MEKLKFGRLTAPLLTITVLAIVAIFSSNVSGADGPDPAKLAGRWLRSDGGYMLQLSDPGSEGQLQAAYFNPRPVNVSKAAWKHEEGYLGAFIELRAPNYPGSTYTLVYDATNDHLVGIYFHAGLEKQFEVEFKRQP